MSDSNTSFRGQPLPGIRYYNGYWPNSYHQPHTHDEFMLGFLYGDAVRFTSHGAHYPVADHTLVVMQAGEKHAAHVYDERGTVLRQLIFIQESAMRDIAMTLRGGMWTVPYFPLPISNDSRLNQPFLELLRCLQFTTSLLHAETTLLDVLHLILQQATSNPIPDQTIGREHRLVTLICEYLHDYCNQHISLDDLAQITQFNKFYLLKVFQQTLGMTPHHYQTLARIERAKDLLVQQIPAAQVARLVGFTDQSHLIRMFKKHMNYTPGWFQSQIKRH